MNLGAVMFRHSLRQPDAPAIVEGGIRRSYEDWYPEICAVAGGLAGRGISRGDHLVVLLPNRYETATLYWACQMLGVIFTPFNWRAGAEEVSYVLEDAEAAGFVFASCSRKAATAALGAPGAARPAVFDIDNGDFDALAASSRIDGPSDVDESDTCLMLYTSGTTGRPKGVPRSHRAERLAATHCSGLLRYGYGSSSLGATPMFHTMGVRSMLMSVLLNGALVCLPFWDPAEALRLVEQERIDNLFLVPTMFHDMLTHPDSPKHDLSSARNLAYAGMSMTTALTELCAREFQPEHFANFYGSSEIFTFSVCDHVITKPGCAGRPGIAQVIRIVRPDGSSGPDDIVDRGESGEICVPMNGMEAFAGYWKRPDADRRAIRDGWYFTGDLGYLDEDGELYVVGRVDDMIISGGENIYPEEVEDVLARSPLVAQVAVVGLPDDRMGSRVAAFIEPARSDCSARMLDAWCLESALARFKRPRAYVFVEKIPRSASGKLLRRQLRDGNYRLVDGYDTAL